MFVHQSPRRHSERLQNAYEDGTDEDEQDLLQPADRHDHGGRDSRSFPQDYHPRHTQLHTSSRMFADHQRADNAVPTGPFPNAFRLAHTADESIPEAVHAELANTIGKAALPPSQRHSLPSNVHAAQRHATRATQEPLEPLAAFTEAHGQGRATSLAALQYSAASCRDDHQHHSRRKHTSFDPGGGRGLYSVPSEPIDRVADNTTNQRLRRAMKLNLCLLCLREGHPAVSCPRRTTRPCKTCRRGQHNRALCKDAADDKRRRDRRPSPVRANRDSRIDPEASDQQRHSRTSAPARTSGRIAEQSVIRDVTCCVATATTLRQSGTQSSRERISGNLMNRKKRTKDLGTDPPGRTGTNRPPTISTDESITQHGAEAYGSDRLLPGRYNHLQTDTCSTHREMMQIDRTLGVGSVGVPGGIPDEKESRELYIDEDVSHQSSEGLRTDKSSPDAPDETRFPPYEESTAYVACASDSDEQPAVLHECLAVTAMNPVSKKSRRAVIMFDSGSSYSQVSSKLAQFLDLPRQDTRLQHVSIFGSQTHVAFNGFRTFLVLCSAHGRCLQVNVTVLDRIVSSVRTALVREADLSALRSGDCVPTPTREMPDLLIGQDLVHLFDRQLDPTLPCGFYVVRTSMGPTIGGASLNVTPPPKAPSSSPPAALPAAEDTDIADHSPRWSLTSQPSTFEPPTSRRHPRLPEFSAYRLAHTADGTAESPPDSLAYCLAHTADNTATCDTNECLNSLTSTSFASSQPSKLTRVSGALPQPSQKQPSTNPLDAKPLLLPTHSTNSAEVKEVPMAHNTAGPPKPIQEPLSSVEARLRCSLSQILTHGNLIRASLIDAGSHLTRKTRLRCPLPASASQSLGIYAAREPVAITLLLPPKLTCFLTDRAELDHRLVPMSSLP